MNEITESPIEIKDRFGWHGSYSFMVTLQWKGQGAYILRGTANDVQGALLSAVSRLNATYPDSPAADGSPPDLVVIGITDD